MRKDEVMKLSEQVMFWPGPVARRRELSNKIAQLEAEKKILREGIIRALQIPIGAVLDQHTRFALTDALKEE